MAKSRISAAVRKFVRERARGCCEYCLCSEIFTGQRFTIDHITPESRGGTSEAENFALCCVEWK